MHVLEMILLAPIVLGVIAWWTFGGGPKTHWQGRARGRTRAGTTYTYRCPPHHRHKTPDEARACAERTRKRLGS